MAFGNATKGYVKAHSGSGGGGASNYNDLSNKPKINGVELTGNKTSEELNIGGGVSVIHYVGDDVRSRVLNVGEYSALKFFGCTNDGYSESSWIDGIHTYYWADSTTSKTGSITYGDGTVALNSQNSGLEFNALNVDYYIIVIR